MSIDPLGDEAGRLCRYYDRAIRRMSEAERDAIENLGDQLISELASNDGELSENTKDVLRETLNRGQLPCTEDFISALCLVNWPLPLVVVDPPEES